MASKLLMGLKKQEATDIESGEGFIDLERASNPKHVESDDDSDDLQSRGLITISDNPSGTQSLDGITKNENQMTTINDLPPEIIRNIFDTLTPCIIFCNPMYCIHYPPGADILGAKFTRPERLRYRRSPSSNFVPDAWYPCHNGHLGGLIETWEGLRYY